MLNPTQYSLTHSHTVSKNTCKVSVELLVLIAGHRQAVADPWKCGQC